MSYINKDTIISTAESNSLNVSHKFVYNLYVDNETTIDDSTIIETGINNKYRYIEIDIQNTRTFNNTIRGANTNQTLNMLNLSAESSNYLSALSRNNFDIDKALLFNKLYDYDNTKSVFYNKTQSDIDASKEYYLQTNNSDMNFFNIANKNNKVLLNRKELNAIQEKESNHTFPSENELNILSNYNNIVLNLAERQNILQSSLSKNIFSNFVSYAKGNSIDAYNLTKPSLNSDFNAECYKTGLLVEKYKLKDDGSYEILTNYYIHTKEDYCIKDEAIKYGETYLYICSEVFNYAVFDSEQDEYYKYLVCDYPFFTLPIVCKEYDKPNPPDVVRATYSVENDKLKLFWQPPSNYQGDAKGYQILKRSSLEEPYTVIAQLEFHSANEKIERIESISEDVILSMPGDNQNYFIDEDFDPGKVSIYAVRTLDAHGLLSDYSSQIAVFYKYLENYLEVDLVSRVGAPLEMPNLYIPRKTKLFENEEFAVTNLPLYSNKKEITVMLTPDYYKVKDLDSDNDSDKSNLLKGNYLFTLFKLNNQVKYEENIEIKNFFYEKIVARWNYILYKTIYMIIIRINRRN